MYFMTELDVVASKFFIYTLFVYFMTLCLTAMYRMFAALSPTIDDAVRFAGTGLNLLVLYVGYVIPKPQLTSKYIWFGWLYCKSCYFIYDVEHLAERDRCESDIICIRRSAHERVQRTHYAMLLEEPCSTRTGY